ncbi:MAG: hypothetical protein J7496_06185 [Novosphingobium sp.]|nr:hypothetical protein [Novosphingobium sp.]
MNERTSASDIFRMAAVGSLIGMTAAVAGLLAYWIGVEPGDGAMILVGGLFGLLFGLFLCCVLTTPVGFVAGLLLGLSGHIGRAKAMLAGLITGLVSVATVLVFFIDSPRDADAVMIAAVFLFPLLGAVSGFAAQRIVSGRRGLYQ